MLNKFDHHLFDFIVWVLLCKPLVPGPAFLLLGTIVGFFMIFAGNKPATNSMYGGIMSLGSHLLQRFYKEDTNFEYGMSWLTALRSASIIVETVIVFDHDELIFTIAKSYCWDPMICGVKEPSWSAPWPGPLKSPGFWEPKRSGMYLWRSNIIGYDCYERDPQVPNQ